MNSLSNNNKPKQQINGSFFEQLKDLGSGVAKTAVSETGKIGSGIISSFFDAKQTTISPWESQNSQQGATPERFPWKKPEISFSRPQEIQIFSHLEREEKIQTQRKIERLVEEIRKEIIFLQKKQKTVISEATKITVETLPANPGPYHLRFFEWILKLLRDLRKKVNESATWLAALRGKKSKRGYWQMYKKQGTQFGLSGERTVATQAG